MKKLSKRFICMLLVGIIASTTISFGVDLDDEFDDNDVITGVDINESNEESNAYSEPNVVTVENDAVIYADSEEDAERQLEELLEQEETGYSSTTTDQTTVSDEEIHLQSATPFETRLKTGINTRIKLSYNYTTTSDGHPNKLSNRKLTFDDALGVSLSKEDIESHTYKKAFITTFHVKTKYSIFINDVLTFKTTSTYYKVTHSLAKKTVTWKQYKNGAWKEIASGSY